MASVMNKIFPEQLSQIDVSKFVNLGDEKLILAVREHSAPLIVRLLELASATIVVSIVSAVASYFLTHDIFFSLATFLTSSLLGVGFFIRELVHWYFHLYVITTKKIVEVSYNPLFSELSNSILLDQLRCTEIDAEMHGFISELFDIGNVTITFDRPTHREEFILKGIHSPRKIANHLSSHMHGNTMPTNQEVWYKDPNSNKNGFRFTEDPSIYYGDLN